MKDSSRRFGSTNTVATLLGITSQVLFAAALWACGFLAPAQAQVSPPCATDSPPAQPMGPLNIHPPTSLGPAEVSTTAATAPPLLPPRAVPKIPDGDDIILYLHGGPGSRLEEASDLAPWLLAAGPTLGRQFTLIAFDQPSQGYTEHQGPLCVADLHSTVGDNYPLVQFNEDFVVKFVDALDKIVPIENRNIFIIGGSTGGMLALRMGHRSEPWIKKIVAWNPASVWTTYAYDWLKGMALTKGFDRAERDPANRKDFFDQVFGPPPVPLDFVRGQPNPEEWYRGDRDQYQSNETTQQPFRAEWRCKWDYIGAGRLEMQEVYTDPFLSWHWRFGTEELLFSFFNDSWTGPAKDAGGDSKGVYQQIHTPTLLLASDDDDWNEGYVPADKFAEASSALGLVAGGPIGSFVTGVIGTAADAAGARVHLQWENRWTRTNVMGRHMQNTPGYLMLVPNTGHSIHNERPQFLASEIAAFVSETSLSDSLPESAPLQLWGIDPGPDETCHSDFNPFNQGVFQSPSLDYPDGRYPKPISALLDLGIAANDPGGELKGTAQLGGNFTDGSSPGRYSLRLRTDLRLIAKAHDPAFALIASALAHDRGDDVNAKAMADLSVTGRNSYSAFVLNPPSNSDLISRLTSLLPSTDPQRLAADVDFAKNRAIQVAWALRNPNTQQAFHDRAALGWIAVSAEDDPPDRPVNVPSGIPIYEPDGKTQIAYYPQFDLPVKVDLAFPWYQGAKACTSPTSCTVTFVTRYTIASGPRLHLPNEPTTPHGGVPPAVNGGTAVSPSHSTHSPTPANSGMRAVLASKFSVTATPARLLSASACLTNDGAKCLPANTPPPPVGQPRRAIVTVKSSGKPVSGVRVSVPSQGVIGQTGKRGAAVIRYRGCFAMRDAPNAVPKARPCQVVVRKPGFAPDEINVP